jgi:hypothetical protein
VKLSAYLLAADPTWLRSSVPAYYPIVDRIVVSYDQRGVGWSGAPIPVEACLAAIAACDPDGKVELIHGDYTDPGGDLMQAETRQRRAALAVAGIGMDWVLQLDGDEVLPDPDALLHVLQKADTLGLDAVEWPMRVLFRRARDGGFLEVAEPDGRVHVEYPGAIAVRPGVNLVNARRAAGSYLRVTVASRADGLQIKGPARDGEERLALISSEQIIWHNSWARSARSIRTKTSSWGHANGWRSWWFYVSCWYPAPVIWRAQRDFHPFARGLWPRLRHLPLLPIPLDPHDMESPA